MRDPLKTMAPIIQTLQSVYFVLDELGDRVAGPFLEEAEAYARILTLPEGEFHVTSEYWGGQRHPSDPSTQSPNGNHRPKLLRLISKLSRPRVD